MLGGHWDSIVLVPTKSIGKGLLLEIEWFCAGGRLPIGE
jgi:hypothetical protein